MPDIFDQVAEEKRPPPQGDIFDEVALIQPISPIAAARRMAPRTEEEKQVFRQVGEEVKQAILAPTAPIGEYAGTAFEYYRQNPLLPVIDVSEPTRDALLTFSEGVLRDTGGRVLEPLTAPLNMGLLISGAAAPAAISRLLAAGFSFHQANEAVNAIREGRYQDAAISGAFSILAATGAAHRKGISIVERWTDFYKREGLSPEMAARAADLQAKRTGQGPPEHITAEQVRAMEKASRERVRPTPILIEPTAPATATPQPIPSERAREALQPPREAVEARPPPPPPEPAVQAAAARIREDYARAAEIRGQPELAIEIRAGRVPLGRPEGIRVPEAAPPRRGPSFLIQRGVRGAVRVKFASPLDADIFAMAGRIRRGIRGEPTSAADIVGLQARLERAGIPRENLGPIAVEFRESVMNAIRGLEEGTVFNAARFQDVVSRRLVPPAVPRQPPAPERPPEAPEQPKPTPLEREAVTRRAFDEFGDEIKLGKGVVDSLGRRGIVRSIGALERDATGVVRMNEGLLRVEFPGKRQESIPLQDVTVKRRGRPEAKRGIGRRKAREFGETEAVEAERFARGEGTFYSNPVVELANLYTRTVGRPLWEKGTELLLRMTPEFVGRGMVTRYGQPREFVRAHLEARTEAALGAERGLELGRRLARPELSQAEQQTLGRFIEGKITEQEVRRLRGDKAMNDAVEAAKEARTEFDNLGGQAVVQGLLADEVYFINRGKYMPHLYRKYELPYEELLRRYKQPKPSHLDLERFKKRTKPDEYWWEEGITEPGYPVAKGIMQIAHDVAFARFFNRVAENPEWAVPSLDNLWMQGRNPADFVQLPKSPRLGKLSEMYVQKYMAEELNGIIRRRGEWDRLVGQLVSEWKIGKVILNPSTHARNMMSNAILAHLGGLPITRLDIYYRALQEMKNNGPLYQELRRNGLTARTFVEGELEILMDSWNKGKGGLTERFAAMQQNLKKGRVISQFRTTQKLAKLYQAEEVWFKTAKAIHSMEKGMTAREAVADAHKWLFDYTEVPKWVAWSRRSPIGAPFLTFTYKALPAVAESIVTAPWRMGGILGTLYVLQDQAAKALGYDTEREKAKLEEALPPRMRGEFLGTKKFVLLPFKDKYRQLQFLDLTYILPWGDIGETGGMGREYVEKLPILGEVSGLIRQMPVAGSPFITAVGEIGLNKSSFTGKEIYKPYDDWKKQTRDINLHLWRSIAPSLAPGGYAQTRLQKAITEQPDYFGRTTSIPAAVASTLMGLKITPIDPAQQRRFRLSEMRRTFDDIDEEIFSVRGNRGLSADEKRERIQELREKKREIRKEYFKPLPSEGGQE